MTKDIDEAMKSESSLTIHEPQNLDKPKQDTEFAKKAADFLVDIIKKNNWSRRLGGQSEHIQYEGWQTAGKFYGYTVKTYDAEYVELGGTWGFKAKAVVVNENTGIEIGSAEAFCMSDEQNWRNKPKFQLASMAQTRAGSKALRQNLGFVVALAGYAPTPIEEMEGVYPMITVQPKTLSPQVEESEENGDRRPSEKQLKFIESLLRQKGFTEKNLMIKYDVTDMSQLTGDQASTIISNLLKLTDKIKKP